VELAVATQTAPAAWWGEPDEVIATALDVLADAADRIDAANPRAIPRGKRR
jgi:hypothetical protein